MGSGRSTLPARAGVLAVTAALLTAGTALLASPADATVITSVQSTSWSYTDSAQPRKSFVDPAGDAPIGAKVTADHQKHVSKSYFTFDLSGLRGAKVISAELSGKETAVADCSAPRGTELWVTAPAKNPPTWDNQPRELSKVPGPGSLDACPSDYLDWDAAPALQQAIDAGRTSLTMVLRLPDDQQHNPRFGRAYRPMLYLSIQKNQPPVTPSALKTGTHACAEAPLVRHGESTMSAAVSDPDDPDFSAEFAWWPVDHPDQRATGTRGVYSTTTSYDPDAQLADGVTYAWQVRAYDSLATSAWSETCRFTTDFTAPATAPVITSADYTYEGPGKGGTGIPGDFTLDARGDTQIAGFQWNVGDRDSGYVAADRPGGKATVRFAPRTDGPMSMVASGVDVAGNRGPSGEYWFLVAHNGPSMACTPAQAYLGETRQCQFSPYGDNGATEYLYQIDNGPETTVPAGPDGTATITVTPTDAAKRYDVSVRARMTNGNLSSAGYSQIPIDRGLPVVDVPGGVMTAHPAVFTLHATLPGSVSFTYDWDYGDPVTIPVGPDGTAQVTIVPAQVGQHWLRVHTTTGAGLVSATNEVNIVADTNGPTITSVEYPKWSVGAYVTTPGTFTFSSPIPGAVSYTYRYRGGDPVTVPAGPDGTASAVLTPLTVDSQYLNATTTFADGTVSEAGYYSFSPRSAAPPLTCDATGDVRPGQVIHCTVTPVQPGLASYGYVVETASGPGPDVTVRPGADGAGAFEVTVPADQTQYVLSVRAWSANAAGQRTDTSYAGFWVPAGTSVSRGTAAI
ncbi:hypothetical protein [Amycolatopsis saalfeldensis]|uniref:hypothetical protein n=1 Tax=Amycolatopsis saalfeldensis TaxID=394193 RepID=UPI000B8389E0|nr:hypothetical protein [Amycolatopsis saalfeldensis]